MILPALSRLVERLLHALIILCHVPCLIVSDAFSTVCCTPGRCSRGAVWQHGGVLDMRYVVVVVVVLQLHVDC